MNYRIRTPINELFRTLSFQAYDLARCPIYRRVPSTITAARTHLFFTRMNSLLLRRHDDAYLIDLIDRISHSDMLNKTPMVQYYICYDFDTLPFRSHQAPALQCHNLYILPHF